MVRSPWRTCRHRGSGRDRDLEPVEQDGPGCLGRRCSIVLASATTRSPRPRADTTRTQTRYEPGQHVKDPYPRARTETGRPDHLANRLAAARRPTAADEQQVRVLPRVAGRQRHPATLQRTKSAQVLADHRMAHLHRRTNPLLGEHPVQADPQTQLIQASKQHWRIEHDYREVKTGFGLEHYEGRKWVGRHHVTLVAAAHAFLT